MNISTYKQKQKELNNIIQETKYTRYLILPWAVTLWATKWSARRFGGFLQGGRHDFRWKIEVRPQKLNSIIGEVPVIVHPSKSLTHVTLGFKALHELNRLQIWDINLWVLCKIVILLCIADSLCSNKKKCIKICKNRFTQLNQ